MPSWMHERFALHPREVPHPDGAGGSSGMTVTVTDFVTGVSPQDQST